MNIWLKIVMVAVSSAIGGVVRYIIELALERAPVGFDTWVINSLGCLIIGICAGWLANTGCQWNSNIRETFFLLTMTGFCGGFSTFSTFTLDCVQYYQQGKMLTWLILGTMTIFVGLFGCAIGYYIGKNI